MESSSDGRILLRCDACGVEAWIGRTRDGWDAWCECCQHGIRMASAAGACARCGTPLTTAAPRFMEAGGQLQNLSAVLAAAAGDPAPLRALLPERPRHLADLNPPAALAHDPPPVREALARLAGGQFREARARLDALDADAPHVLAARAIARTRAGDATGAEAVWSARLARGDDAQARLNRGVLRAQRGALAEAAEDFARAGDTREAHWNRAATALALAVERAGGMPEHPAIDAARAEAGAPSPYWSDLTIGRLLWILLVERGDRAALRAAEPNVEFDTFWDRALLLWGYATLGALDDARRVAAPLATRGFEALDAEPWARWSEGPWARGVAVAHAAHDAGAFAEARRMLDTLRNRDDMTRHRTPCRACGSGAIGADAIEETGQGG